jgi:hypothetical protein
VAHQIRLICSLSSLIVKVVSVPQRDEEAERDKPRNTCGGFWTLCMKLVMESPCEWFTALVAAVFFGVILDTQASGSEAGNTGTHTTHRVLRGVPPDHICR